jgi:transposase
MARARDSPHDYGAEATTEILRVATAQPGDLGLGFTTWSLPKLEEYLRQRSSLKHLARSTIRRRLRASGLRYRAGQTWCQSADPDFEEKNQVVSLYCNPPQDGIVVCMDEMGPLQTIPRGGRSWGRRAARYPDRYKRNGTVQLMAAFAPHRGHGVGRAVPRKTGEATLEFLQSTVLPASPEGIIYLVWDNLSAHKKALRLWEPKPERVRFVWIPTDASWLNLIEAWFSVLERTALHNTYLRTPAEIEASLLRGIAYLNEHPKPYRWTKTNWNIAIPTNKTTRQIPGALSLMPSPIITSPRLSNKWNTPQIRTTGRAVGRTRDSAANIRG